jgi:hypothetical protein
MSAPVILINAFTVPVEESEREAQASPEFRAAVQRLVADPGLHVTARPAIYDVVVDVPADST